MATTQPRGASWTVLRLVTWELIRPSDSPIRMPDLFISVPSDEDPSDSLDDLTAAVEGIKI